MDWVAQLYSLTVGVVDMDMREATIKTERGLFAKNKRQKEDDDTAWVYTKVEEGSR
jgi:hypothetical protein